jgi:hypothetical protein
MSGAEQGQVSENETETPRLLRLRRRISNS